MSRQVYATRRPRRAADPAPDTATGAIAAARQARQARDAAVAAQLAAIDQRTEQEQDDVPE
jgi:hypothetical protein